VDFVVQHACAVVIGCWDAVHRAPDPRASALEPAVARSGSHSTQRSSLRSSTLKPASCRICRRVPGRSRRCAGTTTRARGSARLRIIWLPLWR
jgi:hypothetical protein